MIDWTNPPTTTLRRREPNKRPPRLSPHLPPVPPRPVELPDLTPAEEAQFEIFAHAIPAIRQAIRELRRVPSDAAAQAIANALGRTEALLIAQGYQLTGQRTRPAPTEGGADAA